MKDNSSNKTKQGKQANDGDYIDQQKNNTMDRKENNSNYQGTPTDKMPDGSKICVCGYDNAPGTKFCLICKGLIVESKVPPPQVDDGEKKLPNGNSGVTSGLESGPTVGDGEGPKGNKGKGGHINKPTEPVKPSKTKKYYLLPYEETNIKNGIKMSQGKNTLTRDMLDSDNTTISGEHAIIEFKEGIWRLKDISRFKETYVRVSECELKDGDVICFGDRRFKFLSEE